MPTLVPDPWIAWDGRRVDPTDVQRDGLALWASFGDRGTVEDRVLETSPDGRVAVVERRWDLRGEGRLRTSYGLAWDGDARHGVVPAVCYDGNRPGSGAFPRGGAEAGRSFREDRCALPSASFLSDGTACVGLWASPAPDEASLSCVRTARGADGRARLSVEWPLAEEPWAYRRKWDLPEALRPAVRRWHRVDGAFRAARTFFVFRSPSGGIQALHDALRWWWERRGEPAPAPDRGPEAAARAGHVLRNLWVDDGAAVGAVTARLRGLPVLNTISAGFLGRNAELALSLFRLGARTGQSDLQDRAARLADFLCTGALPGGLMRSDWRRGRRAWVGASVPGRDDLSVRMMGESGVSLLRLGEAAAAAGRDGSRWTACAGACASALAARLPADGNPGRWLALDGTRLDGRGTNGAYGLWLMAEVHARTGDPVLLAAVRRAADWAAGLAASWDLAGDTLDADCVDKEAGHAVQRALWAAWLRTGDPAHLAGAAAAARFVDTWAFAWDVPFGPDTPLGRRACRTTGGTSVSVAHHHLDPYGAALALDHLRLADATDDAHFGRLARWMLAYSAQLVATPDDPLDRPARFSGWQPEQVNHTDWAYWSRRATPRGCFWSDIAWVPSLVLGALLDLADEFPAAVPLHVPPVDLPPPGHRAFGPWGRLAGRLNPFP